MAHPVVVTMQDLKTLFAVVELGKPLGMEVATHFQPLIDRPELLRRFVDWGNAGMPDFPVAQPAVIQTFEDPEIHNAARKIMGENFHGIAAAQRRFGAYSEAALEQRKKICLFDEKKKGFLSAEDTLVVLNKHKATHVLVATHEIDLVSFHGSHKDRFSNDAKPWFSKQPEKKWSSVAIAVPWLFVRKEVIDQSWNKDIDAQKAHVPANERLILPAEFCYCALLHYLETGKKLCSGYWVRFPVQDADGYWVLAYWSGDQLGVLIFDGKAFDNIASGSVWASYEP